MTHDTNTLILGTKLIWPLDEISSVSFTKKKFSFVSNCNLLWVFGFLLSTQLGLHRDLTLTPLLDKLSTKTDLKTFTTRCVRLREAGNVTFCYWKIREWHERSKRIAIRLFRSLFLSLRRFDVLSQLSRRHSLSLCNEALCWVFCCCFIHLAMNWMLGARFSVGRLCDFCVFSYK